VTGAAQADREELAHRLLVVDDQDLTHARTMAQSAIIERLPAVASESRVWERRGAGLLVVALALALYAPTLWFHRVQLDDMWLWDDTSPLRHVDGDTLREVWLDLDPRARHPFGTEYLPVRDMVVAADMAVWGESDRGPHATQLALYALTLLALGTLLVRFGVPRSTAWVGTLLWAVHPLHVETVAWLTERKGELSVLLVLACGHAWVRYRAGGARWWLALAAIASVAATWSKAPAMFGWLALAAIDGCLIPAARRRWLTLVVVGAATVLAAVPVVVVAHRAHVIAPSAGAAYGPLVTTLGVQGHYLEGLVLARPPSIAYPIQTDGPTPIDVALGALAVLASLAIVRRFRHARDRLPLAMVAAAWIYFVPIGQLFAPVHILVADRFAYMWSLAGCVGAAWAIERLRGTVRLAVTGAVVVALCLVAIRAEGAWTSSAELFERGFAANPHDPQMAANLAIAVYADGRPARALAVLDRGLAEHPDDPELLDEDALILFERGQRARALAVARHGAELDVPGLMWRYAMLLDREGRPDEALMWARRAAARRPENVGYRAAVEAIRRELGR
jgi:hypothetical protein